MTFLCRIYDNTDSYRLACQNYYSLYQILISELDATRSRGSQFDTFSA